MSMPQFKNIAATVNGLNVAETDAAIAAFSKEKNVPTTTFPHSKSEPVAPVTPIPLDVVKPKPVARKTAAPIKRFTVELPDYVHEEIAARALKTTKKFVILRALKADGFRIKDADLIEDGRRDN